MQKSLNVESKMHGTIALSSNYFQSKYKLCARTLIQGAYLTKAPKDLNVLLNDIYREKTGRAHWDGFEYLYNEMKSFRDSKGFPDITYNS